MAVRGKKTTQPSGWLIEIEANPGFCGVDVAGLQFAHGAAETTDPWIAEWCRTHAGYRVTPLRGAEPAE